MTYSPLDIALVREVVRQEMADVGIVPPDPIDELANEAMTLYYENSAALCETPADMDNFLHACITNALEETCAFCGC